MQKFLIALGIFVFSGVLAFASRPYVPDDGKYEAYPDCGHEEGLYPNVILTCKMARGKYASVKESGALAHRIFNNRLSVCVINPQSNEGHTRRIVMGDDREYTDAMRVYHGDEVQGPKFGFRQLSTEFTNGVAVEITQLYGSNHHMYQGRAFTLDGTVSSTVGLECTPRQED